MYKYFQKLFMKEIIHIIFLMQVKSSINRMNLIREKALKE